MARTRITRSPMLLLALLLLTTPALLAQATPPAKDSPGTSRGASSKPSDAAPPEPPVEEWLKAGAHRDFPWKVKLKKPEPVMMDNRMLLTAQAEISGSLLAGPNGKRDLHFVLKIADDSGRWSKDQGYTRLPESLPDQNANASLLQRPDDVSIQIAMHALLGPGKYDVAVIGYDRTTGDRNVWRTSVVIPANTVAAGTQPSRAAIEFVSPGDLSERWLPISVSNNEPVRIDIIALFRLPFIEIDPSEVWFQELSTYREEKKDDKKKTTPPLANDLSILRSMQRLQLKTLLPSADNTNWQTVMALSKMRVDRGCVRATAIVPGASLFELKTVDFAAVDWNKETKRIRALYESARQTADVRDFAPRDKRANRYRDFVHDTLSKAVQDSSGCNGSAEQVRHLVLFVTASGFKELGYGFELYMEADVKILPKDRKLVIWSAPSFHKAVREIVSEIK